MSPEAIKALRSRLDLTQEQFARAVGATVSTVNRWEKGKCKASSMAVRNMRQIERGLEGARNA